MADLSRVSSTDLRVELNRRDEEERHESWRRFNEQYGPCPECGGDFCGAESEMVQEHYSQPGYPGPNWNGKTFLVGADFELIFRCRAGHETVRRETTFFEKPMEVWC